MAECCFIIWRNGRARIVLTDPMDPLAPMPDPSALSDVESVSSLNPMSLSDAELVS
jgi:hypothetical protein